MKRKLLYIVEAMGGGVFTYIVGLTNELVDYFEIYIAYAVRPQTPIDFRDKFDKRIHFIEVKNFTRSISLTKDIKAFFEIRKIAGNIKPDIIHLHSSKAGVIGRWAFDGKKTPLFYTPHGYSFLMTNYSLLKRMAFRFIETVSAKRNCMVISCSEGEHHETLKLTVNATYVENGINTKELQVLMDRNRNLEIKDEQFTIFTLGRICYQKNPKLFNQIAEAMPDVKFVWIGDGEMKKELKASNIEITGWEEREEAVKNSLQAHVFMLTSLWEGLPMSLLEAMYMKKICIVSDVIGNRDVVKNGANGFLCDCLDDYVKAIRIAKESGCKELVEDAFSNVKTKYNTIIMAEQYRKIYNSKIR